MGRIAFFESEKAKASLKRWKNQPKCRIIIVEPIPTVKVIEKGGNQNEQNL